MVYTEVDVVAAIVFIRKTFAVVDRPVLELAITLGDRIPQPSCRFTDRLLG